MQITHQYYYRQGMATTKAVIYTILSVLLVAFAVFSYVHWELSFMFTDWHGYVLIIPYFLITLGIILSVFENFKKASKTNRGIPAFAVGDKHFVFFDNKGTSMVVPFENCDKVRFKSTYSKYTGTRLTLIVEYNIPGSFYEKYVDGDLLWYYETSSVNVKLYELDQPQEEIEKQIKKIYNNHKKEHNIS